MESNTHSELREEVQKIMSSYALNCQGWPKSAQTDVDKMVDLLLSKRQEWVTEFAEEVKSIPMFKLVDDGIQLGRYFGKEIDDLLAHLKEQSQ